MGCPPIGGHVTLLSTHSICKHTGRCLAWYSILVPIQIPSKIRIIPHSPIILNVFLYDLIQRILTWVIFLIFRGNFFPPIFIGLKSLNRTMFWDVVLNLGNQLTEGIKLIQKVLRNTDLNVHPRLTHTVIIFHNLIYISTYFATRMAERWRRVG